MKIQELKEKRNYLWEKLDSYKIEIRQIEYSEVENPTKSRKLYYVFESLTFLRKEVAALVKEIAKAKTYYLTRRGLSRECPILVYNSTLNSLHIEELRKSFKGRAKLSYTATSIHVTIPSEHALVQGSFDELLCSIKNLNMTIDRTQNVVKQNLRKYSYQIAGE